MNLKNKIAIITGSSRGFGAKTARAFNGYGAQTVITYLDGDEVEKQNALKLAEEIQSDLVLPLDVRDRKSVRSVMRQTFEKYGKIDILVNNAGINRTADFDKQTDEEWKEVLDTDLKGVFICCQEVLPYITDSGRIINIGSVSGQYGGPRTPSYAVAKAGVMALTHNLARFVGDRDITVNCIAPGTIESDMLSETMPQTLQDSIFPNVLLKRLGKISEVSEVISFFASEGSGYITGQTIAVNGGLWV
jgi:3-oxoacyl-[acyl-carrier protein] reductase